MTSHPADEPDSLEHAGSRRESGQWRRHLRRSGKIAALFCLTLVAVLLADLLLGLGYRTRTDIQAFVTPSASGATRQVLVVFPGYAMDGEVLSKAFAPYLRPDDAMVVARYAERGVDMDDLYRTVIGELEKLNPDMLRVYGASMGGMCAAAFLARYAAGGASFGKAALILDTAPSGAADVKRPSWLFWLSSWYRGGPISSATWALLSQLQTDGPTPEPGADRELIDEAGNRFAWAGVPALTSQAAFIGGFQMPERSRLRDATSRVVYLRAHDADRDPLVRVDESIDSWSRVFPDLRTITLAERDGNWHIPLVERPMETMRTVLSG